MELLELPDRPRSGIADLDAHAVNDRDRLIAELARERRVGLAGLDRVEVELPRRRERVAMPDERRPRRLERRELPRPR